MRITGNYFFKVLILILVNNDITTFFTIFEDYQRFLFKSLINLAFISKTTFSRINSFLTKEIVNGKISLTIENLFLKTSF